MVVAAGGALDVNGTLGALCIGVLISVFLFGIATVQAYIYYSNFPEDKVKLKILVAVVWILELAHCISICHSLYFFTISSYGDPRALIKPPSTLYLTIIFSGFIVPIVQAFFAERVRVISGRLLIPIVCWTLSVVRFSMSLVASAEAFRMTTLEQYQKDWKWLLTTVLAMGAATDIIVAAALCFYLRAQRSTSHEKTVTMIDKIIAWTIQTGLMTSLTGLVMLICFLAMPHNFIWLGFFMFLARMFSNSLFASLNARRILRSTGFAEMSLSGTYNGASSRHPTSQLEIRMTNLTERMPPETTKTNADFHDIA
ncbi:unnamed protein product [Cyclocybe aegerita]|uniref:DUF6534 domain-containing protein n=1 Tax=Cyclocybe aegerita TaxID=1973307 RepID=A0A8S0WSR4_CYCAE|nr:unnamed protein product [Cyclocybe aegerita]